MVVLRSLPATPATLDVNIVDVDACVRDDGAVDSDLNDDADSDVLVAIDLKDPTSGGVLVSCCRSDLSLADADSP